MLDFVACAENNHCVFGFVNKSMTKHFVYVQKTDNKYT